VTNIGPGITQPAGVTPTQAPQPTPTSPPTIGTILCQADSSVGWNGWAGSPDWKVLNGMLLDDGTNSNGEGGQPTIVAPCQLRGVANYAVEVRMQVVSHGYNACFGINARGTTPSNGWQGYIGVIYFGCGPPEPSLAIDADSSGNDLTRIPFDAGTNIHTYRIEVKDNNIRFLVDGAQIVAVTDNKYLTGEQVGLWSYESQLEVNSFEVIAL